MISQLKNESWKRAIPFIIIAVIIFIFNILSIWGFDGLITDDQGYYFKLYDKSISDLAFSRNIFHAIFTLAIIKIAVFSSVFFARFLIVVLLCIPCAFLIYYFSHYQFQLKKYASIAVAVFPFILANEVKVPTYMVGSYILLAILFALISLYFILKFSEKSKFSITEFILAVVSYYIATESSELIASMLPVFLFPIFIFRKLSVRQFLLGSILCFIAVRKALFIINNPFSVVNSVNNDLPISVIKNRIIHFLDFINPFHDLINIGILNIILVSIILIGAIILIINHKRLINVLNRKPDADNQKNKYFYIAYYYLFPLTWLVFSVIPFLFFSHDYSSRYFTFASVATGFLLVTSISIIIGMFTTKQAPCVIVLIFIMAFSGFNRQIHFIKGHQNIKYQFKSLKQTLVSYNFPEEAQIVVAAPGKGWLAVGDGVTQKSNGTLQYILQRRDIRGQIMVEKRFYDPFQIFDNAWVHRYTDIDTTKNTYLFRCFNHDSSLNSRFYYALRWQNDKSKDSRWSIFHFDESGVATNLVSGNGYESYESAVDSLSAYGTTRDDILFGGIPAREDSLRLGLLKK